MILFRLKRKPDEDPIEKLILSENILLKNKKVKLNDMEKVE